VRWGSRKELPALLEGGFRGAFFFCFFSIGRTKEKKNNIMKVKSLPP